MPTEFLTESELENEKEMQKVSNLKNLVFGRGDDGLLCALGLRKSEKIIFDDTFVDYLIRAGFAKDKDEARQKVLPKMEGKHMCYKTTPDLSYSISIHKVRNDDGREAYRVSRYIG